MTAKSDLTSSLALIRRVDATAIAYTVARLQVLERIPGNPVGAARFEIGDAIALSAQKLPSPSFNRVVGLRAGQAQHIQPLVEWRRQRGGGGSFEIAAGDCDAEMGRELARLGFFQSGFHAALIGAPDAAVPASSEIKVDLVASAPDMEAFLAAYVTGWDIPEAARDQFKVNVRPWLGQPGWRLYVARIDDRPIASAILFFHRGVGYFADSSTDPAFRKRGVHAALLARRMQDASDAGVDFVCSGADFLSTSHRNMERAGMRLLFLRAIWTSLA